MRGDASLFRSARPPTAAHIIYTAI